MSNYASEHLQAMFSKMENYISSKTVIGEAVHFGDVIIVPLIEVTFGVGSGLGEGKKNPEATAGGGAMGGRLVPVAVVVIVNGSVQLVNVKNQESVNKLIDLIPGVLSKFDFGEMFSKFKKDDEAENKEQGI